MSSDLRDLFKKELDQIPLRPTVTWVPQKRATPRTWVTWRLPLSVAAVVLVLVAALIGGRQLAALRDPASASSGATGATAVYLSPSFNGSGWIQIDPHSLQDLSTHPLLDIAPTKLNSFQSVVSADGSTIVVGDFTGTPKYTVYDARTGKSRGPLVPEVNVVGPDYLSADGTLAMGIPRGAPITADKIIFSVADGHVVRRVPTVTVVNVGGFLVAPDLSALYYLTTPSPIGFTVDAPLGLQPYSVVVQDTRSGATSAPVALPGITGGAVLSFGSPTVASRPTTMRPAVALSDDGARLALLSPTGNRTLAVMDTKSLAVTTVAVRPKTTLFDWLKPLVAEAKTLNDEELQSIRFSRDGAALLSFATSVHYDDLGGQTRTGRGVQRTDVATGVITAESKDIAPVFDFTVSRDGMSLYTIVRTQETPTSTYVLRRYDARTLVLQTQRSLPDYAELKLLAAPSVAASASSAADCVTLGAIAPRPAPTLEIADLGDGTKRITSAESGYSIVVPSAWIASGGQFGGAPLFGQLHVSSFDPRTAPTSNPEAPGMLLPEVGIRLDIELWANPFHKSIDQFAQDVRIGPDQIGVLPGSLTTVGGVKGYRFTIQDEHRFSPGNGSVISTRQTRSVWLVPTNRDDRLLVIAATPAESSLLASVERAVGTLRVTAPVRPVYGVTMPRSEILKQWLIGPDGAPIPGRRAEAKLMTYAEASASVNAPPPSGPGQSAAPYVVQGRIQRLDHDPDDLIWIVAVSGPGLPEPRGGAAGAAPRAPTTWMLYGVSATGDRNVSTGAAMANQGTWPPQFDALADRCR